MDDTVVFAVVIFEEKSQSEFFEVFFDSSLTIRAAGKLEASGGEEVVSVTSTKEVLILDSIRIWLLYQMNYILNYSLVPNIRGGPNKFSNKP